MFNNQNILAHYFGNSPAAAIYYNEVLVFPSNTNIPYITLTANTSITMPTDQFTVPLLSSSYYDATINWGDGTNDIILGSSLTGITHVYPDPGIYVITIF